MTNPERAGMTTAVIPARGGSKGIPGKNLQPVGGTSLIGRAVTTARACVERVVVTTDCDDIAAEAERHGAQIVKRPAELARDRTTSEDTLLHAVEQCDPGEWFVFIQCTSPFLTPVDLARVIDPVDHGRADVAFTVAPFEGYVWQPTDRWPTGVNFDPFAGPAQPRQERPVQWLETGAAYCLRTEGFVETGRRFYGRCHPVVCAPERSLDINDPHELEIARVLAPRLDSEVPSWST